MKITRRQLRRMILNEVRNLREGVSADQIRKALSSAGIGRETYRTFSGSGQDRHTGMTHQPISTAYGSIASGEKGTLISIQTDAIEPSRVIGVIEKLGEAKVIAGQEDQIIEVASELLDKEKLK